MSGIAFEWDEVKNQEKTRKHGIAFQEAETVFSDEHALLIDDPEHSGVEDRFVLLGLSADLHTLVVCHPARARAVQQKVVSMKKEYDFSKARRNPYASRLRKPVTIRLDGNTVTYFKELARETGIPYQTLINLYLRECAANGKKLSMAWKTATRNSDV